MIAAAKDFEDMTMEDIKRLQDKYDSGTLAYAQRSEFVQRIESLNRMVEDARDGRRRRLQCIMFATPMASDVTVDTSPIQGFDEPTAELDI